MSKKTKTVAPTVTLEGHVEMIEGKDTSKGDLIAEILLRVDEEDDELVRVTAYDELAEACIDVLKEGTKIKVSGLEKQGRYSRKVEAQTVIYCKTGESLGE